MREDLSVKRVMITKYGVSCRAAGNGDAVMSRDCDVPGGAEPIDIVFHENAVDFAYPALLHIEQRHWVVGRGRIRIGP